MVTNATTAGGSSNGSNNGAADAAEAALVAALNGVGGTHAAPAVHTATAATAQVLAECPLTATRFTLTVPVAYTHGTASTPRAVAVRVLNPLVTAQLVRGSALVLTPYWHAVRAVYALTECVVNGRPAITWADALPEAAATPHAWKVLAEWAARAAQALRNADGRTKHGAQRAFAVRGEAQGLVQALTQWCCDVCSVADHGVPGLYAPNAAAERQAAIAAQLRMKREARDADTAARLQDAADALARKRATVRSLRDAMDTVCEVLEDLPCAEWTQRHSEVLHATRNSKALHSATTLQRLHARIAEHFPDATFVGERAAAAEQIVLQHLCSVMLNAAARLRAIAFDAEEVAEADALERTALAEQMQSPGGKFHTVAVQRKGAAVAVAAKLGAALQSVNARSGDALAERAAPADAAVAARDALKALAARIAAARAEAEAEADAE